MKKFKVGVFYDPLGRKKCTAYTMWYNLTWKGCCEHTVEAINGNEAKKIAIKEHKNNCLKQEDQGGK